MNVAFDELWRPLLQTARAAGLDTHLYGAPQRRLVEHVAAFLSRPPSESGSLLRIFGRGEVTVQPVAPVILYGPPGTGKTVFLSALDVVLRRRLALPDRLRGEMTKADGRSLELPKRSFNGQPISVMSVNRWSQLLHFYAWDVESHRFDRQAQTAFIRDSLRPMRVIFADEVELAGYAPTLPDIANEGVLVVGTSNQSQFAQLDARQLQPWLLFVDGDDLRGGEPEDAVARDGSPAWQLFERASRQPAAEFGNLEYRVQCDPNLVTVLLAFDAAMQAPLLEMEWTYLLSRAWLAEGAIDRRPLTLLLDEFSLTRLESDFNAVIRFTTLLDAIEQLGAGLLLRSGGGVLDLSLPRLQQMKRTIETANGVPERIVSKTVAGIDRARSRIGAAGRRAQSLAAKRA